LVLKPAQITRRIKRTLRTSQVTHAVAERKATWQKFGAEKGKKAGPDTATTTVAENIRVKLSAGNKVRRRGLPLI
jgi:translation initiation factor 3 subunit G